MKCKIKKISSEGIAFDNGCWISDYHCQDCCESVYADFEYLKGETSIMEAVFDLKSPTLVEVVVNNGIRLVSVDGHGYFIPCYDRQNGYYSNQLELRIGYVHGGQKVIDITECSEFIYA
jgi:hypothetical protein